MSNTLPLATIKQLLTACHEAKRVTELQPPLPPGLTPANLKVLDCIDMLTQHGTGVKVSDIATTMQVTRPGITRLVRELEAIGSVQKIADATDGRIVRLQLTAAGRRLHAYYINQYHSWLATQLDGISESDIATTAATIARLYAIMSSTRPQLIGEAPQIPVKEANKNA